jgi:PTH1 family peptidyl-tRNA hydrolase
MKLIVGLGNPGDIYRETRHNIGFSVVKALAKVCKIPLKRERGSFSLSGKGKLGSQNVIMAIPLSFMNLSGTAVAALLKKYKIASRDFLVVADDLDLEFGRLKIRPSGSSAGHRGLNSITGCLGTQEFARLRIGIGRPGAHIEASDYVLSQFNRREKAQLKQVIENACDCCRSWARNGITETMNLFNVRSRYNE